ncbi:glutamyl-tRNA reductase [Microbacterium betulae]|uniref:Glutamyl-tRNA reductase n=1 Tax=Microbacterium betulae TaxID=2981139 RepID=A0AA97I631_9MICO|nr:glutamyl-tRNA reductase [Microbacterium sp. AB]WOF23384.1 glutamyl-tRNA reductase [Microbacterium sp. AB]
MLFCLSASHKTAPFDLLERLSTHTTAIAPLIAGHRDEVSGAVVLSTCNRFEAYIDLDLPSGEAREAALDAAQQAIRAATGVSADDLDGAYEVSAGGKVAEHLFSVASGLESVVIGEGEIGGQVRRALEEARDHGTASSELERLFQRATETQKGVKNATALGRAGRSLVRLALDLAASRIADWTTQRALLVGTGSYAAATIAALRDHGVVDIVAHSPSGRGARFAAKHGLRSVDHDGFAAAAAQADLVITCTSREEPVIDAAMLRDAGFDGATMIIDLGMPRNVAPDVATLAGVTLLDLETIRLHAPLEELQATDAARAIVQDAAARFHLAGRQQSAQPAIVALRKHVFELTQAEVDRARRRGEGEQVEHALRHLVGVLLHDPTARAARLAAEGRSDEVFDALETLFGIDARPAAAAQDAAVCPFTGEARAS